MSQTVCKQLVITQFSENHYFPMKCWTRSKLGFGMASAAPMMHCSPVLQVHMEEGGEGGGGVRGAGEEVFYEPSVSLLSSRAEHSDRG